MHKQLVLAVAVIIAASLLTMPLAHEVDAQSKKKPQKCNNVKIHANVSGVEENQTLVGVVSLDGKTVSKQGTVEVNETSLTLPFNFKKLDPCPALGTPFSGFVNGTEFSGELKSIKKPNKVNVDL